MDLNVTAGANASQPSVSAATNSIACPASNEVPQRRLLRSRPERDAKSTQSTNRRTISRPRRHIGIDAACSMYLANIADAAAAAAATDTAGDTTETDAANAATFKTSAASAAAAAAAAAAIPKEIARFYMHGGSKSARVKSTCLETIEEQSEHNAENTSSAMAEMLSATETLMDSVNFLNSRKFRRSLAFTAAKVHQPHMRNSTASKTLSLRRRRRIREKLGRPGSGSGHSKFSMAVFMEKMRALHDGAKDVDDDDDEKASTSTVERVDEELDDDEDGATAAATEMEATE